MILNSKAIGACHSGIWRARETNLGSTILGWGCRVATQKSRRVFGLKILLREWVRMGWMQAGIERWIASLEGDPMMLEEKMPAEPFPPHKVSTAIDEEWHEL